MGSKIAARERMRAAGVPIVPGTTEPLESAAQLARLGDELGWPLAIKASAGGGGKGLKVVRSPDEAERAFESARREGEAYFSDATVYIERYLEDPRHVEVQVLADAHGNVIHLGERDCTIQRRHQKLVEETPSPAVDDGAARADRPDRGRRRARRRLPVGRDDRGPALARRRVLLPRDEHAHPGRAHRHRARHRDSTSSASRFSSRPGSRYGCARRTSGFAGTRSSAGSTPRTPSNGFRPTPGRITRYREPAGPGVRVDSGVEAGSEISPLYDPMVAKLIVHGQRPRARAARGCCGRSRSSRSAA